MWLDINSLSLSLTFVPIPTHKQATGQAEYIYVTTSTKVCCMVMQHTATQSPHSIQKKCMMHPAQIITPFIFYIPLIISNIIKTKMQQTHCAIYICPTVNSLKFGIPIIIHVQRQPFHNVHLQSYQLWHRQTETFSTSYKAARKDVWHKSLA